MLWATMCPSPGEITVSVWRLVLVFLCGWLSGVHAWYSLFCVDDCLVCTLHTRQSSIQSDKYKMSHIYSCFSWWWGLVAWNMYRKEINTLRKIVHQVGFIYKIIQGCTVNETLNSNSMLFFPRLLDFPGSRLPRESSSKLSTHSLLRLSTRLSHRGLRLPTTHLADNNNIISGTSMQ